MQYPELLEHDERPCMYSHALELREPDDVPLPHPSARPVAALPLLDGYRCIYDGCRNLCASVKRMRRHWADVHGGGEELGMLAREVKMQTFFHGTKIRYFEVCECIPYINKKSSMGLTILFLRQRLIYRSRWRIRTRM